MLTLRRDTQEASVKWQANLYTYDHLAIPDEYKAAHQLFLRFLPEKIQPHWLFASSSDGINVFGRKLAKASFHAGWVNFDNEFTGQQEAQKLLKKVRAFPARYAAMVSKQIEREKQQILVSSAHMPLMARSIALANPELKFQNILYGASSTAALAAFQDLHATPERMQALHAAVLDSNNDINPSDFTMTSEALTVPQQSYKNIPVDMLVVERPFCDTVFTATFPQMTTELFASMAQILRTRTAEFRSRLWQRGGIYGAGLEVSIAQRTFSWWTNLDHHPLATLNILKDILQEAGSVELVRHEPERALAFLPTPAPQLAGKVHDCQDQLWGISKDDRDAIIIAPRVVVPQEFWTNLLESAVFCVAGPSDNIKHISHQLQA